MRVLFLLIATCLIAPIAAQPCLYLAYEPFDYPADHPLNGQSGGSGWAAPWDVQNQNTSVPGYQTGAGSLVYADLQTKGGMAGGGFQYLAAGRRLNTAENGPFGDYVANGGGIGSAQTGVLYASCLLKKRLNNSENVYFSWHGDQIPWYLGNPQPRVEVGYFGAASEVGGVKYWSVRINGTHYLTPAPVSIQTDVLMALRFTFAAGSTGIALWINPAGIGNDPAPAPDFTQTVNTVFSFRSFGLYLGSSPDNGQIDEIRMADSYACALPDANVPVNLPPVALISADPVAGMAPLSVQFSGAGSSDPEGGALSYQWQFGDGTPVQTGPTLSHTFQAIGELTVSLTVTDPEGLQHIAYQHIKVLDSNGAFPCQSRFTVLNMPDCGAANGHVRVHSGGAVSQLHNSDGLLVTPNANQEYSQLAPGIYRYTAAGANGCRDTFMWHIKTDSADCPGWNPPLCAMDIGTNMSGLADWSVERPFRNLMKNVRSRPIPYTADCFCWSIDSLLEEMSFDAAGYPLGIPQNVSAGAGLLRYVISADGGNLQPGHAYVLLYEGQGVLQVQGAVSNVAATPGRITFDVTEAGNIWFNITQSNPGNHVRNIRLLRPEDENANLEAQPFYQGFLDKISPFKMLRFMDWGATNNNPVRYWSERTTADYFTYAGEAGVPYEKMIQLANQLQKDVWICVPHAADDAYVTQMATLFKNGLDPALRVYVEYSNEVWNWIFEQAHYNDQNRPSNLNYARAYAEKARRVFRIWHEVYGPEKQRVQRVLGIQTLYNTLNEDILSQLDQDEWDYGSPTHYIGLDHGNGGNPVLHPGSTPQDVIDNARHAWYEVIPSIRQDYHQIQLFGKKIATYEGGQHFVGNVFGVPYAYQQAMWDAQYTPAIYALYDEVLDSIRRWDCILAGNFSLATRQESVYGSWGVLNDIDVQPPYAATAPKYQALLDNITADADPTAAFSTFISADTVRFTNLSVNGVHYEWSFGDGQFSTEVSPVHVYEDEGVFTVQLRVRNACGESMYSEEVIILVGATADASGQGVARVFPNPNTGAFTVVLDNGDPAPFDLALYNAFGQALLQVNGIRSAAPLFETDLAPGWYGLHIRQNGKLYRTAVVVVKGR